MDSLTHIALGAAVGMAVMRRRTAMGKAALWGAVAATLPDLDIFIDHEDPILNMVLHRAETHALFWLSLLSLPLALCVARWHAEQHQWRRWCLALWLALVMHPLLDLLTVYGTQLLLPFSNRPYGVASIFIIDPLVTLPCLAGAVWALVTRGSVRGLRANSVGLALSLSYLAWSVGAQQHVARLAAASLAAQGITAERMLVTPTAFNTLLWRVVAVSGADYHEGFHALLDAPGPIAFERYDRGAALDIQLQGHAGAQRIRAFSHGFYRLHQEGSRVLITDLRMGQEPRYVFRFAVAELRGGKPVPLAQAEAAGQWPDVQRALPWLWQRLRGQPLAPPR